MKILQIVFCTAFISYAATAEELEKIGMWKACFMPFGIGTLVPVTFESIEDSCDKRVELDVNSVYEIKQLIRNASPGSISGKHIRAVISSDSGDNIYFDEFGGVQFDGIKKSLSKVNLDRVIAILESASKRTSIDRLR